MAGQKTPLRPDDVPSAAAWNADENEWELGERNDAGQQVGAWTWWRPDGGIACTAFFDDAGAVHGELRRWHPNGELAQWSPWIHGKTHGVQAWTRPTSGEPDASSRLPPNLTERVRRMDMPYVDGQPQVMHFTVYNAHGVVEGVRLDERGRAVDLAADMFKVEPETTFFLVEPSFQPIGGDPVEAETGPHRWVYKGQEGDGWKVRRVVGRETTDFVVSSEELSRAFTLSTDYYLTWLSKLRPAGVPEEANWNAKARRWEHGAMSDGRRVGVWCAWNEGGALIERIPHTAHGTKHGLEEHFHPDGTTAYAGQVVHGTPTGLWTHWRSDADTPHHFPVHAAEVWRVELVLDDRGEEVARRHFLRDETPCNRHGVPLVEAHDDALFLDASPATFVADGFARFLSAHYAEAAPEELVDVDAAARTFEDLWGIPMPGDLVSWLTLVARHRFPSLFEWRTELYPTIAPLEAGEELGNSFERLVLWSQEGYLFHGLHQLFSGSVCVGTLGNGDSYLLSVFEPAYAPEPATRGVVYFFDHDEMAFDAPFAADLDHMAYASSLADAFGYYEAVSAEGFVEAFRRLSGKISPTWHWDRLRELAAPGDFAAFEPEKQRSRHLFWCSAWIIELLRGYDRIEGIEDLISPDTWLRTDDEPWEATLGKARRFVPIGLHLLWRSFFFDEEEQLADVLTALRESPARLLRDAAALVDELRGGRRDLGSIEDIFELRDRLIEADLHPQRAAQRARAEEEEERAAEARAAKVRELVTRALSRGADPAKLLWAHLEEPEYVPAVIGALRDDPTFMRTWSLVERLATAADDEREEILERLAADANPLLEAIIVSAGRNGADIPRPIQLITHVVGSKRAARALLPVFDFEDRTHHWHAAVARLCGRLGMKSVVPKLADVVLLPLDSRGKLFNRDYVNAAIEALSEIGGKAAVAALGEALLDDRPTAVLARAIERVGLKKAFEWLVESLDRDLTPESLWAIAALAPTVSKKRRAFAVRAIEKIEKQPFATMIAQQHALRRLGAAAPDLGMWVRTALAPEANPYSFDAGVAQKVWSLRAAAEHDDLEPEVITAWLTHENRQIHRAAAEAAARRGFEVVLRPLDRRDVDELFDASGLAGLHDALADPAVVQRHNVVSKLREVADPSSAGAIGRAVEAFVATWKPVATGGDTPRELWLMMETLHELGDEAAVVAASRACLAHADAKMVDAALRQAPPHHESLIEAMVKAEAGTKGWKQSAAREWLDSYPDPEKVAALRD